MATIDNQQIPKRAVDEFKKIIENIPPASLLSYVKSRPELIKGFRPTHVNLNVIRKRLGALFTEKGEVDKGVLSFLADESFNIELITVLSEKVLSLLFSNFAQCYGFKFIVAALLDKRDEVRKLAHASLQTKQENAASKDRDENACVLREQLAPFLDHLSVLMNKEQAVPGIPQIEQAGEFTAELKKSRKKIIELEKRLEKNKERNRVGKKLSNKLESKESEIIGLREKLDREKKARKELEAKVHHLSAESSELKRSLDKEIKKGIDKEMKALVRGWLKKPRRRAVAVSQLESGADDDILIRLEDVLSRQEAQDRDFGNKKVLNERLKKLQDAKEKILQIGSDAINPLPELLGLKKELDLEIEKIQGLLGKFSGNTFIENLKIRINTTPTSKALTQIKDLLSELEQNNVLQNFELKELYLVYNRRMELLYERYGSASERSGQAVDSGWSIKKALDQKSEVHLVVDGHNVLFGLNGLFRDYYEEGVPSAQAREKLLELLEIMLAGSNSCASVFFDGSVATERSYSQNIKEIYSGGGSAEVRNRADGAILDYLFHLFARKQKVPVFVVTNDLELQKLALKKGAKIISLSQFDALTSEFHA